MLIFECLVTPMLAGLDITYAGGWSVKTIKSLIVIFCPFSEFRPRITLNKFDKILICRTEKLYAIILNSRPIDAHLINKFFKVPGFLYIFSSLFTLNFDISDIWIPKKV